MELPLLSTHSRSSFGQRFTKHGVNDCMYAKHTTGPSTLFSSERFHFNKFVVRVIELEIPRLR